MNQRIILPGWMLHITLLSLITFKMFLFCFFVSKIQLIYGDEKKWQINGASLALWLGCKIQRKQRSQRGVKTKHQTKLKSRPKLQNYKITNCVCFIFIDKTAIDNILQKRTRLHQLKCEIQPGVLKAQFSSVAGVEMGKRRLTLPRRAMASVVSVSAPKRHNAYFQVTKLLSGRSYYDWNKGWSQVMLL